ncbi:MAG: hypothetical protein R6U31_07530 [bacterium]
MVFKRGMLIILIITAATALTGQISRFKMYEKQKEDSIAAEDADTVIENDTIAPGSLEYKQAYQAGIVYADKRYSQSNIISRQCLKTGLIVEGFGSKLEGKSKNYSAGFRAGYKSILSYENLVTCLGAGCVGIYLFAALYNIIY